MYHGRSQLQEAAMRTNLDGRLSLATFVEVTEKVGSGSNQREVPMTVSFSFDDKPACTTKLPRGHAFPLQ